MDISYEELVLIERVGKILGLSNENVNNHTLVGLIKLLCVKVEGLQTVNESHREMVEGVKNLIKELEG